jgi:hypothetical protein
MMNVEKTQARMKELRTKADAAIDAIPEADHQDMGAVNWADISTCEVRWWINDFGQTGFTVTLEEASPGSKLAFVVWEAMGSPEDVEVVCEW